MENENNISVVIPIKSDENELKTTLKSLCSADFSEKVQVIVVNDGNSSQITNIIRAFQIKLNLYEVKIYTSKGQFFARNEAIKLVESEWILFLDGGIKLPQSLKEEIKPYLKKYDYLAGNVKMEKSTNETDILKLFRLTSFRVENYMKQYKFGITAFLFVRKKTIEEVNGFDGRLYSGGDKHFGRKVFNHGYKQMFLKSLVAYHSPKSLKQHIKDQKKKIEGRETLITLHPKDFKAEKVSFTVFLLKIPLKILKHLFFFKKHYLFKKAELPNVRFAIALLKFQAILYFLELKVLIRHRLRIKV